MASVRACETAGDHGPSASDFVTATVSGEVVWLVVASVAGGLISVLS